MDTSDNNNNKLIQNEHLTGDIQINPPNGSKNDQNIAFINFSGKCVKIYLNSCGTSTNLQQTIIQSFGLNLNQIENFGISAIGNNQIYPLTPNNIIRNFHYNLHVTFKTDLYDNNNRNPSSTAPMNNTYNVQSMQDTEYFGGYSNLGIHRTMIQDKARTGAYLSGINECADFIKDKIVLDVGTGTGILSIFSAKAGAKHVYSVDASNIARDAALIISANSLDDRITVIESKIEEAVLPCGKVDVIVSEWMGAMLLFESMLLSVINARDKYLSPGGLMLPSRCDMLIAPLDITEFVQSHLGFWDDVYGVDMSVLNTKARCEFFSGPIFTRCVKPSELLAPACDFFSFEVDKVTESDVENILNTFSFEISRPGKIHGFVCWFDVTFRKTVLSTSPDNPNTHWNHTMLVFDDYPDVVKGNVVEGIISMTRSAVWGRHYEITVKYWLKGCEGYYQKRFPLPVPAANN